MSDLTKDKDIKTFSELTESSKSHNATELNTGEVDIDSNATDYEANATALLQNTAMAITDPYLLPPGVYPIFVGPDRDNPLWTVNCIKTKDGNFDFEFKVAPWVHKAFFMHIAECHEEYKRFVATRKAGQEYVGKETVFPPWIAVMIELETGFTFGTEEFMKVVSGDPDLRYFWINKSTLPNRAIRRGK